MTTLFELDLSNPLHAAAYLKAASFYLSGWPQDWDAETLALALLQSDEEEGKYANYQKKIKLWNPMRVMAANDDMCPYLKSDEMICDLAEGFIQFMEENI